MNRIDTHLHLIYPDRFNYDWTSGFPALAGRAFRIEDYKLAAQHSMVSEAIFMEVDVPSSESHAEAAFFCELANQPETKISGVIASCRPEEHNFAAQLEIMANPKLVGYRRVLHTQPDELSTSSLFRQHIALLGQHNLTFDLCVLPRQHAIAGELIDACPNTSFILDHCGVPDLSSNDLSLWKSSLRDLAKRQNLVCKISGIIAYSANLTSPESLREVVEHTIKCFGWNRVLWGSDWPVCNLTRDLHTWSSWLDELLIDCSQDELAQLYQTNARRIYRLKSLAPAL